MNFNKKKLFFLVFILPMILYGCAPNSELAIKDTRKNFMIELQTSLSRNNIPFRIDDAGYIRYPREYSEEIIKIIDDIDKSRAREIGDKYEHKISTEYLRSLLDEKGISYRAETRNGDDWTYWRPKNKVQEEEIQRKVVDHFFDYEKKRFGE